MGTCDPDALTAEMDIQHGGFEAVTTQCLRLVT